jgi:hypothetical protein
MPGVAAAVPAAEFEAAEVRAWTDMYAAVPAGYRAQFGPELAQVEGVTLTRCGAIPFSHFNAVLDLGVAAPATERQVDAVLASYAQAGVGRFTVLHSPHSRPPELAEWLRARGCTPRGGWERIYRPTGPLPAPAPAAAGEVEFVSGAAGAEWAGFLVARYGLPTGPGWRRWSIAPAGRTRCSGATGTSSPRAACTPRTGGRGSAWRRPCRG